MSVAPVPVALLDAEVAAFPFAAKAALELGAVALDPDLGGDTAPLWRAAENHLLARFPGLSVDELTRLRDRWWFATARKKRSLFAVLRTVAEAYLQPCGPVAVPASAGRRLGGAREPSSLPARQAWRWLARRLPADLLLASIRGDVTGPSRVDPGVAFLSRRLRDEGFAEVHLHLGAAFDFDVCWIATLHALMELNVSEHDFRSPGGILGEGIDLGEWLVRASLVRLFLGWYLVSRPVDARRGFAEFLNGRLRELRRALGLVTATTILDAIGDLNRGRLSRDPGFGANRAACRALYRYLFGSARNAVAVREPMDPLSRWFASSGAAHVSTELAFQSAAFAVFGEPPSDGEGVSFARLFWQIQRVRCLYFRHVSQRPMTPGLSWFSRTYDRSRPGRSSMPSGETVAHALRHSGFGEGLRYFEFRSGPDEDASALGLYTHNIFNRLRQEFGAAPLDDGLTDLTRTLSPTREAAPECGLVLHFIRLRGGGHELGTPRSHGRGLNSDPRNDANAGLFRFSGVYRQARKQAIAIATLLAARPTSLARIRGIDLCNDEAAAPIWVYVPLFEHLRRVGDHASLQLHHRLGWRVDGLRSTVHAGEDFGHLLSGLRAVGETVEHLRLGPGDRLGHAIAMGIDPQRWASRAAQVTLCKEQRLFDLAWERAAYSDRKLAVDSGRLAFLDTEILHLARQVLGRPYPAPAVQTLMTDLHDPVMLRAVGFPDRPRRAAGVASRDHRRRWSLLRHYLTSYEVYDRGQELIEIDPLGDLDACRSIQRWLCGRVAERGIAIEINPSSNLLVGDLGSLRHHPFWQLSGPQAGEHGAGLRLVVGSDDPLLFATSLPGEYALLFDALTEAGVNPVEADQWMEGLRRSGIDFRFTDPRALAEPPPLVPLLSAIRMAKELA